MIASDDSNETSQANPYQVAAGEPQAITPTLMLWWIGIVAVCAFGGAVLGALLGYLVGTWVPGYYEAIIYRPRGVAIDPQSIGVGMGATQGFGGGAMLGFALIVLFSWYRTRQANAQ
ncbi:hypothetical protein SV7mr_05740 [Stieleria bergensis]|uniref:Uncharacterized protein n=1 Tax=Stieleria bergensis TaxID=2528025 RepID=A0A517SPN1_9BACT|nr:hypothetical protein SV7mr_05740 [Planctomycetes bacterium SV_7m_r]